MFVADLDVLEAGRVHHYRFRHGEALLRYREVLDLWRDEPSFRSTFISVLSEVPFRAYRWETPAVTTETADRVFECVLLNSPSLARTADPEPFAAHFAPPDSEDGIVVFDNLGGDAALVVPSPRGPEAAYGHLAAFVRQAPAAQNHALWQAVAGAMQERISERPVWLSTAGGGVAWLHVRLDDRPKYYGFRPYRGLP
jgi:hypothetical protein